MGTSKRRSTKEYQQIISDTHSSHWTRFELDLIRCIRDEYPVIYTKTGDWTTYQRASKVRGAWREIDAKFNDIPLESIKAKWKILVEQYSKLKKNADMSVPGNKKFLDGTFSFLDSELHLSDKQGKNKKARKNVNVEAGPSKEATTEKKNGAETENSSLMEVAYDDSIRQLIHEEIDIDDDEIGIKKEEDDDNFTTSEQGMAQPDHNATKKYDREPKKKWDEEELMNATRLTKDMVQELLLIKTRQYNNTAAASVNK